MRNKSLVGWNYSPKLNALIVFANLIDEMTFNYTYDSYKAPALNIISLLDEAEETVMDIEKGMINALLTPSSTICRFEPKVREKLDYRYFLYFFNIHNIQLIKL